MAVADVLWLVLVVYFGVNAALTAAVSTWQWSAHRRVMEPEDFGLWLLVALPCIVGGLAAVAVECIDFWRRRHRKLGL